MTLLPQAGEEMIPARHRVVNFFCQSGSSRVLGDDPKASHPGLPCQQRSFQHICPWEDLVPLPWSGLGEQCWLIRKPLPSATCVLLVGTRAPAGWGSQCCGQGKMLFNRKPDFDPASCVGAEALLSGAVKTQEKTNILGVCICLLQF